MTCSLARVHDTPILFAPTNACLLVMLTLMAYQWRNAAPQLGVTRLCNAVS